MMNESLEELINRENIDWDIIETLITAGSINVNATDHNGNSLLWLAYSNNNHEVVFALLKNGVNFDLITGNEKITDIHRACVWGNSSFLEILFNFCQNVDVRDDFDRTPLMYLLDNIDLRDEFHNLEIIELLFNQRANLNAQDKNGDTCLHFACYKMRYDFTTLLIRYGANPYIKNNKGFLPILYVLSEINKISLDDGEYKDGSILIDSFLNDLDFNSDAVLTLILNTVDLFLSLAAVFDLMLYGLKKKNQKTIDLSWKLFSQFISDKKIDLFLDVIFKFICLENHENIDIVYFLQNIQINNLSDIIVSYIIKYSYDYNLARTNIIFYFDLNLKEKCFSKNEILANHKEFLHANGYGKVLMLQAHQQMLTLKNLCRFKIRNILKYSIKTKSDHLFIPACLKSYLLFSELNDFLNYNQFNND